MTYEEAKAINDELSKQVDKYSAILNQFPSGQYGLIDESVRLSDEYIQAKKNFDTSFAKLRQSNSFIMKNFKKEYMKERAEKRFKKKD